MESSFSQVTSYIYQGLIAFWNLQIFTTPDNNAITIGKIVIGVLLLIVGYFLAKVLSVWIIRRVTNRFKLTESVVAAIETILFYVLIFFFAVFALHVANVPLTIFTVLGGALAIGVGFGSQNVVNNFISGLILLTERPIKVGDLLELDGTYGRVKNIGARSTVIRTAANIDIIVPNSSFLEKNVVNWTRNDTEVRISVSVGVAYGSPTTLVKDLLHQAVESHKKVLSKQEITVIFADFGDNALSFEVHFWANVNSMFQKKIIESEIRYSIDDLFRANQITIAFPQRDIHVDTLRPLEVRVLPDKKVEN